MIEEWKDVIGFEGLYQVSNKGRVKSIRTGKILKSCHSSGGYLVVSPYKDKKNHTKSIHQMVAQAFLPNPNNFTEINHKDEHKDNNIVSNLEWCDRSHNINHGTRNEKVAKKMSRAVIQLNMDGIKVNEFYGLHDAMKQTGIDFRNIQSCCKGKVKSVGGYLWRYADE